MTDSSNSNTKLFWGCFIALVTTSFAFITRVACAGLLLLSSAKGPAFMLACYLGLILWFRSRGGYKAVNLSESH